MDAFGRRPADDHEPRRRRQRQPRGNAGASVTVTVEQGAGPTCPCTIWPASATPATAAVNDPQAVELGVKFRSDADGFITGIRFYKGATNTGAHVGHLWSTAGTMLADGDLHERDGDGVAGGDVRLPSGHHREHDVRRLLPHDRRKLRSQRGFFAGAGVDNPPLHALQDGVDGPNGVYNYGPSGTFPDLDLQHEQLLGGRRLRHLRGPRHDTAHRDATSPGANATGVSVGANITATFSEPMDPATITGATFELAQRGPARSSPASVTYNAASRTAILDPNADLATTAEYTATVVSGASGVKDANQIALAGDHTWTFTTAATAPPPPPPDEAPGGPILVIASPGNAVHALLRRDPARRGLQRVRPRRHRLGRPGRARRPRRRHPRRDVAERGPGHAALRLGAGRRQPDRDAAGRAARGPPRPRARRWARSPTPTSRSTRARARGRDRRSDDPVPRHGRPLHARRSDGGRHALLERVDVGREPGRDAPERRRKRRPGGRLRLRPRSLGRLHAAGQPGLVRPGARRRRTGRSDPNDLFFGAQSATRSPTGST